LVRLFPLAATRVLKLRVAPEQRIEWIKHALVVVENEGDLAAQGVLHVNLGLAQYALNQLDSAIEEFTKALDIARQIRIPTVEGAALGNLGLIYMHLGDVERGIKQFEQHLTLARQAGDRDA